MSSVAEDSSSSLSASVIAATCMSGCDDAYDEPTAMVRHRPSKIG